MKRKRILIIEDDKFLLELLVGKLTKEQFDVSIALDGEEGLKKVKQEKPDLIILDLVLPGMHGFEFLKKIKKDPKISQIPVIILSNLGQRQEIEQGIRLGAVDYLVKAHFTPNDIVKKVKKYCKT